MQKYEIWRFKTVRDIWVYAIVIKEKISLLDYMMLTHLYKPELFIESNPKSEKQTIISRHPASTLSYNFNQLKQFYPNLVKENDPIEHVIIDCHVNDFNINHLSSIFTTVEKFEAKQ